MLRNTFGLWELTVPSVCLFVFLTYLLKHDSWAEPDSGYGVSDVVPPHSPRQQDDDQTRSNHHD